MGSGDKVIVGSVEVDPSGLHGMFHDDALRAELGRACKAKAESLDGGCSAAIHDKRGVYKGLFAHDVVDAGNCLVGVVWSKRSGKASKGGKRQLINIGLSICGKHGGFRW